MNAISISEATKTFSGHLAVDRLSLEVPRGSIFGFIGPNGSGKTTTLRMVLGIIPPDGGEIEVLGEKRPRAASDRIGYLPEERGLYRKMTVRCVLRYFGRLKGIPASAIDSRVSRWLERMDLEAWGDRKVEALSKGMSQKVQFIAAAIAGPEVLILDEPFSGLDPVNADLLRRIVLDLRSEGTTILFSTHDMESAEGLCDRICMIHRGKKVLDGTLGEIQSSYGFDTIRLRTEAGLRALEGLPGIDAVTDLGNRQEVRLAGDPQEFLRAIASRTAVHHFEVSRPSLRDIFLKIAGPTREKVA